MINLKSKKPKWPRMPKSNAAYLKKFTVATLNLEQNRLEEVKLRSIQLLSGTTQHGA